MAQTDDVYNQQAAMFESMQRMWQIEPLTERGDIATLLTHFCDDSIDDIKRFIYAWAIREPALVEAFYSAGWYGAKRVTHFKYKFLPTRVVCYMKPEVVEHWDPRVVQSIAQLLRLMWANASNQCDFQWYARQLTKHAKKIKGISTYSSEHLLRTACVMKNLRHPSETFVPMSPSLVGKYNMFREWGITNMKELHEAMAKYEHVDTIKNIDAGEFAYLMCMGFK